MYLSLSLTHCGREVSAYTCKDLLSLGIHANGICVCAGNRFDTDAQTSAVTYFVGGGEDRPEPASLRSPDDLLVCATTYKYLHVCVCVFLCGGSNSRGVYVTLRGYLNPM